MQMESGAPTCGLKEGKEGASLRWGSAPHVFVEIKSCLQMSHVADFC